MVHEPATTNDHSQRPLLEKGESDINEGKQTRGKSATNDTVRRPRAIPRTRSAPGTAARRGCDPDRALPQTGSQRGVNSCPDTRTRSSNCRLRPRGSISPVRDSVCPRSDAHWHTRRCVAAHSRSAAKKPQMHEMREPNHNLTRQKGRPVRTGAAATAAAAAAAVVGDEAVEQVPRVLAQLVATLSRGLQSKTIKETAC